MLTKASTILPDTCSVSRALAVSGAWVGAYTAGIGPHPSLFAVAHGFVVDYFAIMHETVETAAIVTFTIAHSCMLVALLHKA